MQLYFSKFFISSNETLFCGMVLAGVVMVVLTAIFVAKEIKENHVNK